MRVKVEEKTSILRHEPAISLLCGVFHGSPGFCASSTGWGESESADNNLAFPGRFSVSYGQHDSTFRRKNAIARFVTQSLKSVQYQRNQKQNKSKTRDTLIIFKFEWLNTYYVFFGDKLILGKSRFAMK